MADILAYILSIPRIEALGCLMIASIVLLIAHFELSFCRVPRPDTHKRELEIPDADADERKHII